MKREKTPRKGVVTTGNRTYHRGKLREWQEKAGDIGEIPEVVNPKRRAKCARDLVLFASTYEKHLCYRPFNPDQLKMLRRLERSILGHGRFVNKTFRGGSKTTLSEIAVEWAVLYGHRRWPLLVAATDKLADAMLKEFLTDFEENELLMQDFPEVCHCWRNLEGRYQRAGSQSYHGELTRIKMRQDRLIMPDIEGSVSAGAIISVVSITGAVRGLKKGKQRPDFLLIDDPQTEESAKSEQQTDDREKTIQGSLLGLAGHDKAISAVMNVTSICKGDLTARYMDKDRHPDWHALDGKLVYKWPTDTADWEEYERLWRLDVQAGDGEAKTATAYYAARREPMDAGAEVADGNLFDASFEISAIQHAYNLRFQMGDAFWAEYQGEPVTRELQFYDLDAKLVASRINKLRKWELPQSTVLVTGYSDINHMGMWWAVVAFAPGMTGYVIAYGKHPERGVLVKKNSSSEDIDMAVSAGVAKLTGIIGDVRLRKGDMPMVLRGFGYDRGYRPDPVHSTCLQIRAPFPVIPGKGFGARLYRGGGKSAVGEPGVNCHMSESKIGQFLAMNVDAYKEAVQRGFLVAPGSPGSISLYGEGVAKMEHEEFGQHICSEFMAGKIEIGGQIFGVFDQKQNTDNGLLDAVVGAYGLAMWFYGGKASKEAVKESVAASVTKTGPAPVRQVAKPRRVCRQELIL